MHFNLNSKGNSIERGADKTRIVVGSRMLRRLGKYHAGGKRIISDVKRAKARKSANRARAITKAA